MVGYEASYSSKEIRQLIKRYQEMRSVVQMVAVCHDWTPHRGGNISGKEEILCMLVDIEQASSLLTRRQQEVFALMKSGYSNMDIAGLLNISRPTAKFHQSQAIDRITTYLNTTQAVRMKNGR